MVEQLVVVRTDRWHSSSKVGGGTRGGAHLGEQTDDVPVLQIMDEIVKVVILIPLKQISEKICEQNVKSPIHTLSSRLTKCPRSQAKTESGTEQWNRVGLDV